MESDQLPICKACGCQYDVPNGKTLKTCKICDDARQYVPPDGQSWTTLAELRKTRRNKWQQDVVDINVWSVSTEPKFAIGQRAFLVQTPNGNVLWDCITLLDEETVNFINSKGGLKAIVISHPHFYATNLEWASTFECPILVSNEDQPWLCRHSSNAEQLSFIKGPTGTAREVIPGVMAIKAGGHFEGSLVLHYKETLFIADTIHTVPSAFSPSPRPKGQISYACMWSYPNMIPLPAPDMHQIWLAIKPYRFATTHGSFMGMTVRGNDVKRRVLQSLQIQALHQCWIDHELLAEPLPPLT